MIVDRLKYTTIQKIYKTIKLLEENIGGKLQDTGLGRVLDTKDLIPEVQSIKEKFVS